VRFERVDNLGAYRIPPETGLLIPSGNVHLSGATELDRCTLTTANRA
jgi:hypothetical protein